MSLAFDVTFKSYTRIQVKWNNYACPYRHSAIQITVCTASLNEIWYCVCLSLFYPNTDLLEYCQLVNLLKLLFERLLLSHNWLQFLRFYFILFSKLPHARQFKAIYIILFYETQYIFYHFLSIIIHWTFCINIWLLKLVRCSWSQWLVYLVNKCSLKDMLQMSTFNVNS